MKGKLDALPCIGGMLVILMLSGVMASLLHDLFTALLPTVKVAPSSPWQTGIIGLLSSLLTALPAALIIRRIYGKIRPAPTQMGRGKCGEGAIL